MAPVCFFHLARAEAGLISRAFKRSEAVGGALVAFSGLSLVIIPMCSTPPACCYVFSLHWSRGFFSLSFLLSIKWRCCAREVVQPGLSWIFIEARYLSSLKARSSLRRCGSVEVEENVKIFSQRKNIPCLCITPRNLTITLELGRTRHWRFPAFSALFIVLRASFRTDVLTILAVVVV